MELLGKEGTSSKRRRWKSKIKQFFTTASHVHSPLEKEENINSKGKQNKLYI
jgi:hypothetical protein